MSPQERSRLVARILAGVTPVRPGGVVYLLADPEPLHRMLAEEAFADALAEALSAGAPASEEARDAAGWCAADEAALDKALSDLDDLKVSLYEGFFREAERTRDEKRLANCRRLISSLSAKRDKFRHSTAEAAAAAHKARTLAALCLRTPSGQRVFGDDPSEWVPSDLPDRVVEEFAASRPDESSLRELARTAPWQGYWAAGKPNPFGVPAAALGDDRLALINFSIMYDRVGEHPDRPPQEVVDSDDALDGWLIVQRRKAGEADGRGAFAKMLGVGGEKTGRCAEVFVVARTQKEVDLVERQNGYLAKKAKVERMKLLAEKGVVNEVEFKDVREDLQMKAEQMKASKRA